jgi:hypothetical protein
MDVVEEQRELVENRQDVHFHYVLRAHKSAELSTPRSPSTLKMAFRVP